MKCIVCGEENAKSNKYCHKCGNELFKQTEMPKVKNNELLVIIISILAVIAIIISAVIASIVIRKNEVASVSQQSQIYSDESQSEKHNTQNTETQDKPSAEAPSSVEATSNDTTVKYTMFVANCKEYISLRSEPNADSEAITTIKLGESCGFIEKSINGFYKIAYNGKIGYALAQYLSTEKPAISTPSTSKSIVETQKMYVVNCKEFITLRPKDNVNSGEILRIPLGSVVEYLGQANNGFYKVRYNGSVGYALSQYLSTVR